jgi:hypothetical protein
MLTLINTEAPKIYSIHMSKEEKKRGSNKNTHVTNEWKTEVEEIFACVNNEVSR